MSIRLIPGDCRDVLATLPAESVQCCITSPPYYALRSYLDAAHPDKHREIGSEATPDEYLATMVAVFREIRRVLRRDGTVWCNLGDSYNSQNGFHRGGDKHMGGGTPRVLEYPDRNCPGIKPKDLLLMPARLALALQADGWFIRSAITWCKANPMPESARDRCTSATEMIYMLTKSPKYYFDQDAIRTESGANARNWWLFSTEAFPSAHFATYPTELAERCIKAGSRLGDTILDPFIGAGTTALVADRLQRDCIGIDLNVAYTRMAMDRCIADAPLFTSFAPAEDPEESRMADLFAEAAE